MSFEVALSGLKGMAADLDVISNNIANASTKGYKVARTEFADLYTTSLAGAKTNIGSGVHVAAVTRNFGQGNITVTDQPLDLAISGDGFFRVSDGGSIQYTSDGQIKLDKDGYIVNSYGNVLTGYTVDSSSVLTGTLGNLQISLADIAPSATANVTMGMNVDSGSLMPSTAWTGTTTFGGTAPASNTYTNANVSSVYDSLGNQHTLTAYLSKTGVSNTWDVRVQIDGVDVSSGMYSTKTASSGLVTAGSLNTLAAAVSPATTDELQINGANVGASTSGSDIYSTTDNAGSAIAIAARINTVSGVTARALPNVVNLGAYTAGTLGSGDFKINGQDVIVSSATSGALVTAINAIASGSSGTGVYAAQNTAGQIVLTAPDGRNIQLTTDGSSTLTTFTGFDLTSGSSVDKVQRAEVEITSASSISIGGTSPSDAGLTAGTVTGQVATPFQLVFNSDGSLNTSLSDTISVKWAPLDSGGGANGATRPQTITLDLSDVTQRGSPFTVDSLSQDGYTTGRLNSIDIGTDGTILGRYSNGSTKTMGLVTLSKFMNMQGLQVLGNNNYAETSASGQATTSPANTGSLGLIKAGALEESTVVIADSLVDLIQAQRGYQANAQSIKTEDQATQTILNIR